MRFALYESTLKLSVPRLPISDRGRLVGDMLESSLSRIDDLVTTTEKAVIDLQGRAVNLAAAPLNEITGTYPQLVRYLARKAGKDIRFELVGDHHSVDRQVLERLSDPLRQLLVNAIEHGVEDPAERIALGKSPTATLSVSFEVVDHRLTVVVRDDGGGVAWATVRETAQRARSSRIRQDGRCRDAARRPVLGGLLYGPAQRPRWRRNGPGDCLHCRRGASRNTRSRQRGRLGDHGHDYRAHQPALQDAVLIKAAGQTWGIPEIAVIDRIPIDSVEFAESRERTEMLWNGTVVPVTSFAEAVGLRPVAEPTCVLVVSSTVGPVAFSVEEDLGRRQVAARRNSDRCSMA